MARKFTHACLDSFTLARVHNNLRRFGSFQLPSSVNGALNVAALQEAVVGAERVAVNHLCLAKVHRMACFQCVLCKGRDGYILLLQGTLVFC